MWPLDYLFNRIYRLRKKYDRVRERADKLRNREKKLKVLQILDSIETTLVTLEEQILTRYDRKKMIKAVEEGIMKAKQVLKT